MSLHVKWSRLYLLPWGTWYGTCHECCWGGGLVCVLSPIVSLTREAIGVCDPLPWLPKSQSQESAWVPTATPQTKSPQQQDPTCPLGFPSQEDNGWSCSPAQVNLPWPCWQDLPSAKGPVGKPGGCIMMSHGLAWGVLKAPVSLCTIRSYNWSSSDYYFKNLNQGNFLINHHINNFWTINDCYESASSDSEQLLCRQVSVFTEQLQ